MPEVDRKKEVLKAASQSFSLYGYKATTMDQIAKIARVGKGTIYTFFPSKEILFHEIMMQINVEIQELAQYFYKEEKSFQENMRTILREVLTYRSNHPLICQLVHEIRDIGTPEAMEGVRQTEEALIQYVKIKVEEYTRRGELKPSDPEITAYMLVKTYLTLTREWSSTREPLEDERILELVEFYFLHGVASKN